MLSLNRNKEVTYKNCSNHTKKPNLARHKKRCSVGTCFCTKCHNFSTKSQEVLNYHFAENHSAPKPVVIVKFKLCYQNFTGFYSLPHNKSTAHGFPQRTTNVEPDDIINDYDDTNFEEELRSCEHFLVDSELGSARRNLFNYTIEHLNGKLLFEKHDLLFNYLKCAANMNPAFGFNLKTLTMEKSRNFTHSKTSAKQSCTRSFIIF